MPAFLVRFGIWLLHFVVRRFFPKFFGTFRNLFHMTWKQFWVFLLKFWNKIWGVVVKFLDKITGGLFSKYWAIFSRFVSVIFTWVTLKVTGFWRWLTRGASVASSPGWGSLVTYFATRPILLLLGFIAIFFTDFFANLFGYSFMGIAVYIVVSVAATVMAWWMDFVWTLIDFSSLIDFMGYWSGLPFCFTNVALAAGLSNALSSLIATATACVTIVFVQSLIRR